MTYTLSDAQMVAIALAVIWELVWKGLALWRAGKNEDMAWFIVILLVNSLGIIPIIYLLTHKDES